MGGGIRRGRGGGGDSLRGVRWGDYSSNDRRSRGRGRGRGDVIFVSIHNYINKDKLPLLI